MNKTYSLLLAACASVALFTTPAFAMTAPKCPVCGSHAENAKPYPIKVVNPTRLPPSFVKSTVNVTLKVDENGVPSGIRAPGANPEVASRVIAAVSQWRFSPKYVNGVPVAGLYELPIVITPVTGA